MIYILDQGGCVRLGGTVANAEMLREGWQAYEGPVPLGDLVRLEDGVLVVVEHEPAPAPAV